ncbi:molecular chaperone HtpG [Methylocella sp. CPCC 101449]|uniref:molecular chaperone HtpG n=1 Tax=Methylocella sp. CPCC 101449 TaxID=2987531 RepID=UPI00288CD0C5|nr:molecular chaperone HtpG [Methylocella sp. CPCC 101449]MDT2020498.1 molecular chaperone HtpG [Methylocella sp. CPCC 101449]
MTEATAKTESHAFQADVARLLHLMVHSIYSDRDIFLRELISNGADACEKLRYLAVQSPELLSDEAPFQIDLTLDKDARTLTITDNGIGMDRADLVQALGTIASSGTRAFLEKLEKPKSDEEREVDGGGENSPGQLIGQFGIGFYSAFMVADKVDVFTRKAGESEAWHWSSDGLGAYTIEAATTDDAPARGTRVVLHIKEDAATYLETYKIESVVREHSGAVQIPVELRDKPDAEPRRLTEGVAIWAKAKSDITPEDYTEFYRGFAHQYDEPALTAHWRAEGRHEYTVLGFVPGSRPMDLFDPMRKGRARLYVRRVLITDEADLLPGWMRFFRVLVDSADLPLNVSRELIQQSPVFATIRKAVANRLVQELVKLSENDAEKFNGVWENFGPVIKEGLYEDPERRDQLFKIARFATSTHQDGKRSLADYVKDLKPNQNAIFYVTGDDAKQLAASPQLEGFHARGIEVLLLSDPVDAFWVTTALGFDGKSFKSVTQGAADLKDIPLTDGREQPAAEANSAETASLLAYMKQTLSETVEDVRVSDRLTDSPACLIAPDSGPDRRLERILAEHGRLQNVSKAILEINATHPLIEVLKQRVQGDGDKSFVEDATWLIYDEARLMDGEKIADMSAFANRLFRMMTKAGMENKP